MVSGLGVGWGGPGEEGIVVGKLGDLDRMEYPSKLVCGITLDRLG